MECIDQGSQGVEMTKESNLLEAKSTRGLFDRERVDQRMGARLAMVQKGQK